MREFHLKFWMDTPISLPCKFTVRFLCALTYIGSVSTLFAHVPLPPFSWLQFHSWQPHHYLLQQKWVIWSTFLFFILDECPLQLGMAAGSIPDAYITASSFADDRHLPVHGRLDNHSYWKPAQNDTDHWLQVCFPQRMLLTGVVMQGGGEGEDAGWVEDFQLDYSQDGDHWWKYRNFHEYDIIPDIMVGIYNV